MSKSKVLVSTIYRWKIIRSSRPIWGQAASLASEKISGNNEKILRLLCWILTRNKIIQAENTTIQAGKLVIEAVTGIGQAGKGIIEEAKELIQAENGLIQAGKWII